MKLLVPFSILAGLALMATACNSGGGDSTPQANSNAPSAPADATPAAPAAATLTGAKTYATIKPLFLSKCGCHGGAKPRSGFSVASVADMEKASSHGIMVVAGDPTKSPLLDYLKGDKKPRMPLGQAPFAPEDIQFISDWIKEGAKES
jgi:hypothetical protein